MAAIGRRQEEEVLQGLTPRLATIQEVDPPVVHLPGIVDPMGLLEAVPEVPMEGQAAVLAAIRP